MEEKFNILYKEYFIGIRAYIYKRVNDINISSDLAQDVFTKLFIAMKKGDYLEQGYAKTYIFTLAHNIVFNHIQALDYRNKLKNNLYYVAGPFSDSIHENLCNKETLGLVIRLLDDLSEDNRKTFMMKNFDGLKIVEIAKILKIPDGTVKSRIHFCDKYLKKKGFKYYKTKGKKKMLKISA